MLRILLAASLVTASAATFAGTALADGHDASKPASSSFYAVGRGSASFGQSTDFAVGALGIERVKNIYDSGYMGLVGIGFAAGNNIRAELELSYSDHDIARHAAFDAAGARTSFTEPQSFGKLTTLSVMASGYYDLDMGTAFTPFFGAGIGYGRVKADGFGVTPLIGALPGGVALDDTDHGIAYQFTAGAAIDVTESVAFEVGYRYQGIRTELASVTGRGDDFEPTSHNLFVGLRFGF